MKEILLILGGLTLIVLLVNLFSNYKPLEESEILNN